MVDSEKTKKEPAEEIQALWRAQEELRNDEEIYRALFVTNPDGITVCDMEGRLLDANKAFADMLGYTIEELRGKTYKQITPRKWHKIEANIVKNQILANGFSEVYKKEYIRKDGSVLPVAVRVNTTKNRQGRPVIVWSFIRDITERKRAEQHLKTSLEEKEVLLREIHHRVKNNLQIIVSLLSLQSEYVQDKQAVEFFRDSQFRVKSMALLHERLYETEDLAHINFSDYIQDLTNELMCSYGTDVRNIKLKINVKDVFPSVNVAVPCALIINELVTNCLKHAFPGERAGEIRIEFDSDKQDNYTLLISDDGVGFAKDVDFPDGRTLGLQLVSTLAEQLQGSVVLDKSAGTSFKISFSKT